MLESIDDIVQPVSSFATVSQVNKKIKELKDDGIRFYSHRGNDVGHHTSIYYEGFFDFSENCKSMECSKEDFGFVLELCAIMSEWFRGKAGEDKRRDAFAVKLEDYFLSDDRFSDLKFSYPDNDLDKGSNNGKCDFVIWRGSSVLAVFEFKNEVGTGGCDSYMEVLGYYPKLIRNHKCYTKCPAPAYLIEVVGPHLIVSGGAYGLNAIHVDRLTPPVWMVNQRTDLPEMNRLTRVFKAFKEALHKLSEYYKDIRSSPVSQPRFPAFQTLQGKPLTYVKAIKLHMFKASHDNKKVIVKFCSSYCYEAHKLLADCGHAPNVLYCEQRGKYIVVVMEEVENAALLAQYLRTSPESADSLKQQCQDALQVLHEKDFCHGDFRDCNIMVDTEGCIKIVDFDWAGKHGIGRYPSFMNHQDITWPDGASDGQPLQKCHDSFFLSQFFDNLST